MADFGDTPRTTIRKLTRPTPSRSGSAAKRKSVASSAKKRTPSLGSRASTRNTTVRSSVGKQAKSSTEATPRTLIRNVIFEGRAEKQPRTASAKKSNAVGRGVASGSKVGADTPRGLLRQVIATATPNASIMASPAESVAATPNMSMTGEAMITPSPMNQSFGIPTPDSGSLPSAAKSPPKHILPTIRERRAAEDAAAMPPPAKAPPKSMGDKVNGVLPSSLVNNLLMSFSSMPMSPAAKLAAQQSLAEFFPQMIGDLAAYAAHAGRQTVDPDDVALLLERQRMTLGANTPSAMDLARQYLPMESLHTLLPVV